MYGNGIGIVGYLTKHIIKGVKMGKKPLTKQQQHFLDVVQEDKPTAVGWFRKVYEGGKSRKMAMKMACLRCVWFCREAITNCGCSECPLWVFRPFQNDESKGDHNDNQTQKLKL